jgi:excisionase family DNA binding protein
MVELQAEEGARWLSLGEACGLLQVNQTTLRLWADQGRLRVYRTPGGHRRFSREDVLALTRGGGAATGVATSRRGQGRLEDSALRRIRRGLHHQDVAAQPWYQSIEEEGRGRLRLFGRHLLSLLVHPSEEGHRRQRQEALAQASLLGQEYAAEMADRGVPLKDTVEAFLFFRTMVLDSAGAEAWGPMLELADRVLVGLVEGYQRRLAQPPGTPWVEGAASHDAHPAMIRS